jgi:hypothetical protein
MQITKFRPKCCLIDLKVAELKSARGYRFFHFQQIKAAVFLKTPDIIFSIMQKPFIKCVFPLKISRFLHIRKKLIRRFQKKRQKKP